MNFIEQQNIIVEGFQITKQQFMNFKLSNFNLSKRYHFFRHFMYNTNFRFTKVSLVLVKSAFFDKFMASSLLIY